MKIRSLDYAFILITLRYFFLVLVSSNSEICSTSAACHPTEPWVRFPFRLKDSQPEQCGYPGFDLTCDSSRMTTIQLHDISFNVETIDYDSQEIWLHDPEHCLPKRLLTLNLSGTPFTAVLKQDFIFFNCSSESKFYLEYPISCLSGPGYNVFATSSSGRARMFRASKCQWVTSVMVPVPSYYDDLGEDLRLAWKTPNCRKCEYRGGRCGLKNNSTNVIECRIQHGLPRGARYAIIVGAGIPGFLFLTGLLFCIIRRIKAFGRRRQPVIEYSTTHVVPQPVVVVSGLDEAVIETFPKTVLGESKRLPNPEDNVCSICLGEYKPKESLRTIPACKHCFHSNCIDEWLRLNATCPVCRKNQKQSTPVPEPAPASDRNV
ncbi:OLC1v1027797C1 [Oldenlandia corymbosa var. corymbosa]|uniref:RING-type E3 ubiquitin transferase n=1 Tax=Oldenlandia corymbosa var. corymbosa TaxID=529605 RepID=A0AAV1CAK0_OLDCO|nr:OLC1v1027797C1 [Oldenlandia corymbosa var. corymbosa]